MLPFKKFQDTGHHHFALPFLGSLQFSVHVGNINTSCDWLTKGLHVDLLRHFAALSVLNKNI